MPDISELLRRISQKTADNAGEALSQFLNKKVILHPSFSDLVPVHEFHRNVYLKIDPTGILLFGRLKEELEGEVILLIDERSGSNLINLSGAIGQNNSLGALTEMGLSVLKEMGNVVMGAYITALSDSLKQKITPPLLTFISGAFEQVFTDLIYAPYPVVRQMTRYCMQMEFDVPVESITGVFLLSISAQSGEKIRRDFRC